MEDSDKHIGVQNVDVDPMTLAVKAFKAAAQIPADGKMRYVVDVFGEYYSCLWRDGNGMIGGTVYPVPSEADSFLVCIRVRVEIQLFDVTARMIPRWYKVTDVSSDAPEVEEMQAPGYPFC